MKNWEEVYDEQKEKGWLDSDEAIKSFIRELVAAERKLIIDKWGKYDDGCGCCGSTDLETEMKKHYESK